jgi:hypothetical protein
LLGFISTAPIHKTYFENARKILFSLTCPVNLNIIWQSYRRYVPHPGSIQRLSKQRQDQQDATIYDLLVINYPSTCFGRLYTHHQESRPRVTACGFLSWLQL